jgi:hypothetical protein
MISITVKVDENVIEQAVGRAFGESFRAPGYGMHHGGEGHEAVKRAVSECVRNMDFSEQIARAAKAKLQGIVEEVVAEAVRAAAKKRAKEMTADGTLFGEAK